MELSKSHTGVLGHHEKALVLRPGLMSPWPLKIFMHVSSISNMVTGNLLESSGLKFGAIHFNEKYIARI